MAPNNNDFYRYWGKSSKNSDAESNPYHLLAWHSLDVAACGYMIVKENRYGFADVLAELGLTGDDAANWIACLFACHDIGKFSRAFQQLVSWPGSPLVPPASGTTYSVRHDSLGYWLWGEIFSSWCDGNSPIFPDVPLQSRETFGWALDVWMAISTGHHGKPPDKQAAGCSLAFKSSDIVAATHFVAALNTLFSVKKLPEQWLEKSWRKKLKQQSWIMAGIITLADWLGSDAHYFPFHTRPLPLNEYWLLACERASYALSQLPDRSSVCPDADAHALFPFIQSLTPLQHSASTIDLNHDGPQLLICEDVTGAGKTEAALILTQRLMAANRGNGLYVGLPTMATANAMYQRLGKAYRALFSSESRPSLVLAHGGRHISAAFKESLWQPEKETSCRNYASFDTSASAECHEWFADSAKKALLAEVGVGTIDQLLMAVMPFRHQSLRLVGMRNKILLLDEVHAYDSYMVRLLEGLLHFHAASGGSAIILSATLPARLREKLLAAFSAGAGFDHSPPHPNASYPWLTHLSATGLSEQQLETRAEVRRCVSINWLNSSEQVREQIYQAAEAGCCIGWVRNTVDDALNAFQHLINEGRIPEEDILLFHSRFAFKDRMAIEEQTLSWFGKQSSAEIRRGKVIIATQVIEQSLDIDLDCMISDLAPIDLLIQRAGRLQRHIRDRSGKAKSELPDERHAPVLHVLAPVWQENAEQGWLGEELTGTGYVYPDHARLWLTQALLRTCDQIRMPEDARALVDGVYKAEIFAPSGLQTLSDDVYARVLSQRAVAAQNLLQRDKGYDREASDFFWEEGRVFSTRLSEKSIQVFLAWLDKEGQLHPVSTDIERPWEKSQLQVRLSWWEKQVNKFRLPDQTQLDALRKQIRRPEAHVLLVAENGEESYYSRRCGLTG